MITPQQTAAARAAAIAAVKAALGLTEIAPSGWTYEQRTAYNKALAAYISSRPDEFSDAELRGADAVSKNNYTGLEDAGFDLGMFVSETVRPAGEALQSIGNGVFSVASAAKWVIPLAAAAGLVLLFLAANKRLGGVVPGIKP